MNQNKKKVMRAMDLVRVVLTVKIKQMIFPRKS